MERLLVLLLACTALTAARHMPVRSKEQGIHHLIFQERGYNRDVRPVLTNSNTTFLVKLGMRLSQLLKVSEKHQVLTTNLWLRHEWYDERLMWEPAEYNGINYTHIPSDNLWLPDVVLYNNADGYFEVHLKTKAKVFYNGLIIWEPPAIYKSYCPINVEFFPFDQQECFLKFGIWTYGNEIDLQHVDGERGVDTGQKSEGNLATIIPMGIDLCGYSQNNEWDVINVTARRKLKYYACCVDPFPDICFNVTIRRKTLFYTVNLILPIVAISCLTVLVFYLPSDSGEKITLSISILLTLTVFFLLLSDINPPTSFVIPLLGKYLLFTMIVVSMSIFLTVYTLSIHFRSPATHTMSPWMRRVYTEILPRVLCMERPQLKRQATETVQISGFDAEEGSTGTSFDDEPVPRRRRKDDKPTVHYENLSPRPTRPPPPPPPPPPPVIADKAEEEPSPDYPKIVEDAINGITFIANHLKKGDEEKAVERDWNYVAMVMDRLFLFIFTTACLCGTIGIFLNAPALFDPRQPMTRYNFDCNKS